MASYPMTGQLWGLFCGIGTMGVAACTGELATQGSAAPVVEATTGVNEYGLREGQFHVRVRGRDGSIALDSTLEMSSARSRVAQSTQMLSSADSVQLAQLVSFISRPTRSAGGADRMQVQIGGKEASVSLGQRNSQGVPSSITMTMHGGGDTSIVITMTPGIGAKVTVLAGAEVVSTTEGVMGPNAASMEEQGGGDGDCLTTLLELSVSGGAVAGFAQMALSAATWGGFLAAIAVLIAAALLNIAYLVAAITACLSIGQDKWCSWFHTAECSAN